MKAEELRYDNWVINPQGIETQIFWEGIILHHREGRYKPIPLTEEWLEKFGFENQSLDIFINHKEEQGHWLEFTGEYVELQSSGDYSGHELGLKHVKHVHQLQNLYFALTGEELEVKELRLNNLTNQ